MTIRPGRSGKAVRMAGGTRVVFPAPVGARNTTAPAERSFATSSGRTTSIGKGERGIQLSYRGHPRPPHHVEPPSVLLSTPTPGRLDMSAALAWVGNIVS